MILSSRLALALALSASGLAAAAVPQAAAAAPVSHAQRFVTTGLTVTCGVAIHVPGQRPTAVLCSASGIPAPKQGTIGESGFVQLAATRSPRLQALSQNSFVSKHPVTLRRGRRWSSLGVTCQISQAVMCFNSDNHGFVIGSGRYRSF